MWEEWAPVLMPHRSPVSCVSPRGGLRGGNPKSRDRKDPPKKERGPLSRGRILPSPPSHERWCLFFYFHAPVPTRLIGRNWNRASFTSSFCLGVPLLFGYRSRSAEERRAPKILHAETSAATSRAMFEIPRLGRTISINVRHSFDLVPPKRNCCKYHLASLSRASSLVEGRTDW